MVKTIETKAFQELKEHKADLVNKGINLREWFANDANRGQKLSFQAGDLFIDLSKNLITDKTVQLLSELADQIDLKSKIKDQYEGKHINVTEDRAVLHTALRRPKGEVLTIDGVDVETDIHEVLENMYETSEKIRSGQWIGITGKKIQTIVNIGIGGSDLGPVMAYEALKASKDPEIKARFVSNVDPDDLAEKVFDLDPETTLFIVASKTFTTLETMSNAKAAREWSIDTLSKQGKISNAEVQNEAIRRHFVAVSTALDLVADFGIDPKNAFGFWNWVGGRYSVDSAIGLSLIIAFGKDTFEQFLQGFHLIDECFLRTETSENAIILMGLINIWNRNFFKFHSHAVLPYSQYLHRFPAYLQQLTMESNGKAVKENGEPVDLETGEIFFGEPGTNGQHAFYQLIHQGTEIVPADFIAFAKGKHAVQADGLDMHELLLQNFFAQTKALAFGKTEAEVRAEGTPEHIVNARIFSGNRPSTSIMANSLTPSVLGQLIALYEHITFVEGIVWEIDSFDQWGVELGKKLANEITNATSGDQKALEAEDSSTRGLIEFYLQHKS